MSLNEFKSIREIINENLDGKWCDGVVMIEIEEGTIYMGNNIYDFHKDKDLIGISDYPVVIDEKVFSKVELMEYRDAIDQLLKNNKTIISPRVEYPLPYEPFEESQDGLPTVKCGGNVFEMSSEDGSISINDIYRCHYDDYVGGAIKYFVSENYITEKETKGKWIVF